MKPPLRAAFFLVAFLSFHLSRAVAQDPQDNQGQAKPPESLASEPPIEAPATNNPIPQTTAVPETTATTAANQETPPLPAPTESGSTASASHAAVEKTVGSPSPAFPGTSDQAPTPHPSERFTFSDVYRRAADLATRPYEEPSVLLPDSIRNITYDQYRDIRFRQERSLWRGERVPFEVQFFIRGFFFSTRMLINVVDEKGIMLVPFDNDLFNFGKNQIKETLPSDLGFAGIRLHFPLHKWDYFDELAVFLGASYFRALGHNQGYGISARGIAVDTGLSKPEEFPYFRELWLIKPTLNEQEITLYGLLDGPSLTGAYKFLIKPGTSTVVEVRNTIFLRAVPQRLGIAPLTSMFFFGENQEQRTDDFRPEVHDSDGLFMQTGWGEWIWRPLNNPRRLRISSYMDENPRGFGLQQRDRSFDHYQDLESHYERRPSVWIQPQGSWGKGVVQLVEIPSEAEKYDNIVAYWVPEATYQPGQQLNFEYRMFWELNDFSRQNLGHTMATRIGLGGPLGSDYKAYERKFVIDFEGGPLASLPTDTKVEAVISANIGRIEGIVTQANNMTGGLRVFFEYFPEGDKPSELRCFLKSGEQVLTETWSYQWESSR